MADLNIRLAASAEITNFTQIENLFSRMAGINADVANAMANVLKGQNVVQVEFEQGNILGLLNDIRVLAHRNNLMIKGLYGVSAGLITSPEIKQNVAIAKKKIGSLGVEDIEKVFGGDVLSFLEEVGAMTTNPKGEKLEPLERKLNRANKIVKDIIKYTEILEKSMKKGTTMTGEVTERGGEFALVKSLFGKKLSSNLYKGYVDKLMDMMIVGAGTAFTEGLETTRQETSKKVGGLPSQTAKNIRNVVGQNWAIGKEMVKFVTQKYDIGPEELLEIPDVRKIMLDFWVDELEQINKLSKKPIHTGGLGAAKKAFPEKMLIEQVEKEMIVRTGAEPMVFPSSEGTTGAGLGVETLDEFSKSVVDQISNKIDVIGARFRADEIVETLGIVKSISSRTIKIDNALHDKIVSWEKEKKEFEGTAEHLKKATDADKMLTD